MSERRCQRPTRERKREKTQICKTMGFSSKNLKFLTGDSLLLAGNRRVCFLRCAEPFLWRGFCRSRISGCGRVGVGVCVFRLPTCFVFFLLFPFFFFFFFFTFLDKLEFFARDCARSLFFLFWVCRRGRFEAQNCRGSALTRFTKLSLKVQKKCWRVVYVCVFVCASPSKLHLLNFSFLVLRRV